jgi:peptide/nickel transport system permease protein
MVKYILRRLFYSIFVLFGVATIVFFITRLTGDPVAILLPADATVEQMREMTERLGLDKPLSTQYRIFIGNLARGDLGTSIRYREGTFMLIMERMPATLMLAGSAMFLALAVAIPLGILAALRQGSAADRLLMAVSVVGQAMPVFWIGILMIMLFSLNLRWFPTGGYGGIRHLVLPAIALGIRFMAITARLLRSSLIEVMGTDFIRTSRAKGLREKAVVVKHALRNSMLPVVTVIGLQLGNLLGGSVVTETVFAWPGVGQMLIQAITHRDFPLVQASIILLAGVFVLINLLVDIIYVFIDPRISYS